MKNITTLLLLLAVAFGAAAQGKLVLIGGGGEDYGDWSDAPYQWAVDQSANKRVAIVAYGTATTWIPDYFLSLGAAEAKNFNISSIALADAQSTYDSLVTYDVIFLKGGDQSDYYLNYKNTKTQLALQYVYDNGGVLCGTSAGCAILSPIVYTALYNTIYPDEALLDMNDADITLANDFLTTYQKPLLYDTHFAERGRVGRLWPFLKRWYQDTGESAVGLGVDDRSAICVGADGIGTVMGQAGATVIGSTTWSDSPQITMMLAGWTFDFNTLTATPPVGAVATEIPFLASVDSYFEGSLRLMLSASNDLADMSEALCELANLSSQSDTIVIFHTNAAAFATSVANEFWTCGGAPTRIINVQNLVALSAADVYTASHALKFVMVKCDFEALKWSFSTLNTKSHIVQGGYNSPTTILCDADVSRMMGHSYVENCYTDYLASYHGEVNVVDGLGFAASMVIMSPTWEDDTDFFENTVTSTFYAMQQDTIREALILVRGANYVTLHVEVNCADLTATKKGSADYPVLVFKSDDQVVSMYANSSTFLGDLTPRSVAGNSGLTLHEVTTEQPLGIHPSCVLATQDTRTEPVTMAPNPADDTVHLRWQGGPSNIEISNAQGQKMWSGSADNALLLPVSGWASGIYFVQILSKTGRTFTGKFVKK